MNRLTNGRNKNRNKNHRVSPRVARTNVANTKRGASFTMPNIRIQKNKAVVIILLSMLFIVAMKNNYLAAFFTDIKSTINVFSIDAQYTVTFDPNTGSGSMPDQDISYNVNTALRTNTFTKTNKAFVGWNTAANGSGTSYSNGEEVNNLGDIILYAQWSDMKVKYAVQIYGINEDVDENDTPLGLTFGPALGDNYNNKYVTHTYEETSSGSGVYYVKVVTHTVAANGTESTNADYLYEDGGTTVKVTRTTDEKNKYDVNLHNMTWAQIANTTDKTKFLDCMLCGDTKSVELVLNGTLGSGTIYNQYGDGTAALHETIKDYYKMWNPSYDSTEYPERNNSAATNGGNAGSNGIDGEGYSSSHIRATLIGVNSKTDVTYAGDINLTTDTCLYSCIDSNLRNVITAKKIKYFTKSGGTNILHTDLADKIWCFSSKELFTWGEKLEGIGTGQGGYSKIENNESRFYLAIPTNDSIAMRSSYKEDGLANFTWWCRTPNNYTTFISDGIRDSGSFDADYSFCSDCGSLAFGFCLQGEYTITYDANGGTGTMANQTISNNVPTRLTANAFTKDDSIFDGWNTAADGSGTSYENIEEVSNLGNVTLYAQWKEVYTIKYAVQIYGINQDQDADGNPLGLTFGPATQITYNNSYITHTYEETTPGSNEFYVVRAVHTVAADSTETMYYEYLYKNGGNTEKVVRTAAEKEKYDVNIHTMSWTEIANTTDKTIFTDCMLCGDTKSVTFNLNTTIASGETFTQYGDGTGILYDSIKPYYRMWNPSYNSSTYPERNNSSAVNSTIEGTNARNAGGYSTSHIRATLVGKDSKTNETYAGNVNLSASNSLYSCIENELRNLITAKRIRYVTGTDEDHYTLNNDIVDKIWLFSPREVSGDGETSGVTTEGIGPQGVAYDRFKNIESAFYLNAYVNYPNNTAKGRNAYKENDLPFTWWLRAPSLYYDTHPIIVSYGDITCAAAFSTTNGSISIGFCLQGNYSVSFDANGGTGTMANQTITNNVSTPLSINTYTRYSYVFAGWNTKPDGSGINYGDGETVTNLGNITLYAQWTKTTNYAVQIYGINEDIDSSGNPIGLTFGPAAGNDYSDKYITHEYEETSAGSGVYRVKIITHTVASDGTETTSDEYLYKNGGTTEYVTRTETEKNKYDINLHEMTWTQISAVSDKTRFLDCMLCGDTKKVELALNSTIGTGTVFTQYGDGTGVLYDAINPYYRIWNPSSTNVNPQSNNSAVGVGVELDVDELEHGTTANYAGGYSSSHLRATLIGNNSKTNTAFAGDINLTAANSLYSCLPSSLRSVITAKKIRYATGPSVNQYDLNDDITDKIWTFSEREMYGTAQYTGELTEGLGNDGHGYGKFGNTDSKYYISSYDNRSAPQRVYYNESGYTDFGWGRSISLDYLCGAHCICSDGNLNGTFPNNYTFGLVFGFCIN